VLRTATEIQRKGLTEMRTNLENLRQLARETTESVRESVGVNAEVGSGSAAVEKDRPKEAVNPFKLGA